MSWKKIKKSPFSSSCDWLVGHNSFRVIHVDGSLSSVRSGEGLILMELEGTIIDYTLCFKFSTINNEAEYEALTIRLKIVRELGVRNLKVCSNSQLVLDQI